MNPHDLAALLLRLLRLHDLDALGSYIDDKPGDHDVILDGRFDIHAIAVDFAESIFNESHP